MKRLIALSVLVVALVPGQASAWEPADGSLNIRHDPNEGTTVLDIAEVWTPYGPRRTLFGVKSWYHFRGGDLRNHRHRGTSFYRFRVDTFGSHRPDRKITFFHRNDEFWCALHTWHNVGRGYHVAVKEPKAIYCSVRTNRLRIEKTPRFFVWAVDRSEYDDRAPDGDTRRHVGL